MKQLIKKVTQRVQAFINALKDVQLGSMNQTINS